MSTKINNKYYIYVYLDPRKPGKYVYGEYKFDYEPFYVGFGYGNRYKQHLYPSYYNRDTNKLKVNKILKIIKKTNQNPTIIKYQEKLLEQEALNLETKMIKTIGRIDLKTGPLTNLTDGGESNSNRIISEKDRKNRSERITGNKNPNFGGMSDESKLKMSLNHADFNGSKNPRFGIKIKKEKHPMFGKKHNKNSKIKISINKSKYVYEIKSPENVYFKNIFSLKLFFENISIEYKRFDFNKNNIAKRNGWIIKRTIKEEYENRI